MKKIGPSDPEAKSKDVVASNIEELKRLFPEIVTDGRVDFDVLRQLLGGEVDDGPEKYGLSWHGKKRARALALTPSTATLLPYPEESVDWDTTKNVFIEGDNLEVLKLLQKSYAGKVKLIYIDPPYNTGKDFVYPDDFRDSIRNYQEITGQVEGGQRVSSNTEASGRLHTDWLNMMYPRLRLAHALLRPDGVLFITIDDREVANLRKVCDELFGGENFVANCVWQKKYAIANDDPGIGVMHDNILVYRRSEAFERGLLPRTELQDSRYSNPDNDPKGSWASDNYVSNKSREERPTLWYAVKHPRTGEDVWPDEHAVWRYSQEKHLELAAEGRLFWGPDQSYRKPRLKRYLAEVQAGLVPSTWWTFEDVGHNDEAQKETADLLANKVFSTPKPLRLIDRMLTVGAAHGGIVLDFFAGSASTGHAVMERNAADGKERHCISVQLPEPLEADNKDQKAAAEFCAAIGVPLTVAEIGKERLRRAAARIRERRPGLNSDLGFRVFKLENSNLTAWDPIPEDLRSAIVGGIENVRVGRAALDLLSEAMLKFGIELSASVDWRPVADARVAAVGGGVLIACFERSISPDRIDMLADGIVAWHKELAPADPGKTDIIVLDSAFPDDVAKTNFAAILEQAGIARDRIRSI